jgi:hypothetical protein
MDGTYFIKKFLSKSLFRRASSVVVASHQYRKRLFPFLLNETTLAILLYEPPLAYIAQLGELSTLLRIFLCFCIDSVSDDKQYSIVEDISLYDS